MTDVGMLTIGALAEGTDCSVPTIRYYEEIGLLPKAVRRRNGQRVYGDGDLRRLTFIRRCRDFGFSIDQTRALAGMMDNPAKDCSEARDLAHAHLKEVRQKLTELKALERSLKSFVDSCTTDCAGGSAAECVILDDLAKPSKPACCG